LRVGHVRGLRLAARRREDGEPTGGRARATTVLPTGGPGREPSQTRGRRKPARAIAAERYCVRHAEGVLRSRRESVATFPVSPLPEVRNRGTHRALTLELVRSDRAASRMRLCSLPRVIRLLSRNRGRGSFYGCGFRSRFLPSGRGEVVPASYRDIAQKPESVTPANGPKLAAPAAARPRQSWRSARSSRAHCSDAFDAHEMLTRAFAEDETGRHSESGSKAKRPAKPTRRRTARYAPSWRQQDYWF
jgi:hypothetical protein